jgi:hypothetical protein
MTAAGTVPPAQVRSLETKLLAADGFADAEGGGVVRDPSGRGPDAGA